VQVPKGIKEDDVLPDGTRLKAGMIITYSPYCMGRMSYIWAPDAKEFKPERWLQGGKYVPESEFKFTAFQVNISK
jgi:cytochrome P450